jgi:regulator of CtrA degradation
VSGPGETSAFGLESNGEHAPTIPFIAHFAQSAQFDELFQDGMALVEATADYLDGEGRSAAKELKGALSVTYATESMRLTTRLLEVASWLVIQRALRDGEISAEEAESKRARVRLRTMSRPSHIRRFDELPTGLQALISQSFTITDRLVQIDKAMARSAVDHEPAGNPVGDQMRRLASAFGLRGSLSS